MRALQRVAIESVQFHWMLFGKKWFCYGNKIRDNKWIFCCSTKNFSAATKRVADRTKYFFVVTKYFWYPYFNKWLCRYNKTFFPCIRPPCHRKVGENSAKTTCLAYCTVQWIPHGENLLRKFLFKKCTFYSQDMWVSACATVVGKRTAST